MAGEKGQAGSGTGNTAVPAPEHGDHDRVAMLSLLADGTPDQTPGVEIIGDREFAEKATREQFTQQAVSAVDQVKGRELFGDTAGGAAEDATEDPATAELRKAHEDAASAAEKAADSTVAALFTGDTAEPEKATKATSSSGSSGSSSS